MLKYFREIRRKTPFFIRRVKRLVKMTGVILFGEYINNAWDGKEHTISFEHDGKLVTMTDVMHEDF